jgi:hypothetical protein
MRHRFVTDVERERYQTFVIDHRRNVFTQVKSDRTVKVTDRFWRGYEITI